MLNSIRKVFILMMVLMIALPTFPIFNLNPKADRVTGEIELNAQADAHADAGTGGGSGGGNGGGDGDGEGESGGGASAWAEANAQAIAQIINGRKVELSAYLLESVQGFNRGTYVPDFSKAIENDFMYEYDMTAIRDNRFFGTNNKRKFVFNQDGKFDDEYVEALNWLYSNNLVQRFESVDIGFQEPEEWDTAKDDAVASINSNGGTPEDKNILELPQGEYSIEYDMYGIPDRMRVLNEKGEELATTGGEVSGKGELTFSLSKKSIITIIMNEGDGNDGTAWEYAIYTPDIGDYNPPGISTVKLTEDNEKDSYLYPIKEQGQTDINVPMKRKDFLMQLMKVADGVEESRPLLIESQFAYQELDGKLGLKRTVIDQIQTKFKNQIGATGMDSAINDIKIDFNKYGMHYYYVNPNVYELYFQKAYNSGIIDESELLNDRLIAEIKSAEGFDGVLNLEEEDEPVDLNAVVTQPNQTPSPSPTPSNDDEEEEDEFAGCISEQKIGKPQPRWSNNLPPVRINTKRNVDNNGYYNTIADTNIFGNSWTDESSDCSSSKGNKSFEYNKEYEYFHQPYISYIDAVMYANKAINAYSDEKLPDREVKTIMSMYSINYGTLTEEERDALNYLIAKGIIDGDNAAKYTSPENITVKDAMVLNYRIANPSARLTFKQVYESIDESMLERGFAQSKTTLKSYNEELPEMEVKTTETDDYYVIMNKTLMDNKFFMGHVKFTRLTMDGATVTQETYTSEQLARLGIKMPKGSYTVNKYTVPWNAQVQKLGMTLPKSDDKLPTWIDMEIGGGFYYIDEKLLNGKTKELKFNRALANLEALNRPAISTPVPPTSRNAKDKQPKDTLEELRDLKNEKENNKKKDDPLDLFSYKGNTLYFPKYLDDGKKKEENLTIFIGINETAKKHIMLDGVPLFINGQLNTDLVQELKDIKNITEVDGVPSDSSGTAISEDDKKTFLEFTFPKTGQRTVNELKSLLKRRLTLTGEAELRDEDIASYTGLSNGQTMISRKELKRFGITATKEEPDILLHENTNTYAYLNTEKDYALISNTVVKFPENSLMIEISADEIYYNIYVVMSLLNEKDFYVFNDEGKFEIVKTLKNIKQEDIYNPETSQIMDRTYTADVEKFDSKDKTKSVPVGKFINITSIAGTPATFFLSFDKARTNDKLIYGFEPYYVKTQPLTTSSSVNPNKVVEELTMETANIIQVENLLMNNSLLRKEFMIPKDETFIYTDNAAKVTQLTKSGSIAYYAETYLDFISDMYNGMSEKDVQINADTFKEGNPFSRNKDFEMSDLLDRKIYVHQDDARVKKWIGEVKKGNNVEAFWVLYFLDKFKVTVPNKINDDGSIGGSQEEAFKKKVLELYNKKYKTPSGVTLTEVEDLELLKTGAISETNINDIRLFNIKRMQATPNDGLLSTDESVYVNKNDAVYVDLPKYEEEGARPISFLDTNYEYNVIDFPKYLANEDSFHDKVLVSTKISHHRDMLGAGFYRYGSRIYSPIKEQYKSLPPNEKPLETYPNGHKFKMTTSNGEEEFVIVNNFVTTGAKGKHSESVMVKVAKVQTKPIEDFQLNGNNSQEKLVNYYLDINNYAKSIKSLGSFSSAVHAQSEGLEHTIRKDEIERTTQSVGEGEIVYFDYLQKKPQSVYLYATDLSISKDKVQILPAYPRNQHSYNLTDDVSKQTTKLIFGQGVTSNLDSTATDGADKKGKKYLYKDDAQVTENYMVYESFLLDYGTVSLNNKDEATLNKRTDFILNTSPVLTDIVNELVKAIKIDRLDVKQLRVGDLVNSDKLMIKEGQKGKNNEFVLIKTVEKDKNGYSHFISTRPTGNDVTPTELEYSSTLLLKNYNLFDSVKISANKERKSLYYFIGNQQLNLASSSMINRYKSELEFPTTNNESTVLIEVKEGNKVVSKEYNINIDLGNKDISNGKVREIPSEKKGTSYPYFVSMYLDSNLLVKKNDKGYYEIIGYAEDNLVNTKAFTSRANRYEGVFDSLLSVLPTYSTIEGKFLGFDLGKLELQNMKQLFTYEYWDNLITNAIFNAEQVFSALGIYYVYLLLVLVILGKILPGVVYRWVFNPVKLMTLGRVDIDTVSLKSFVPKAIFTIVLLSLTYGGFIRTMIVKAEEVRILLVEYFYYPFI